MSPGRLPARPARSLAVVTCMDARIDPLHVLELELGDAHVLRNAGAIVTHDMFRSLVISHHLLGTRRVMVIGHTDCGMLTFRDEEAQRRIHTDMPLLAFDDLEENIRQGVRMVRESPLLDVDVTGHVYDVETGELLPVG